MKWFEYESSSLTFGKTLIQGLLACLFQSFQLCLMISTLHQQMEFAL